MTRHRYSCEEKIRVVLEGLKGKESLEAGKGRLQIDTFRKATRAEMVSLSQENGQSRRTVADLSVRQTLGVL